MKRTEGLVWKTGNSDIVEKRIVEHAGCPQGAKVRSLLDSYHDLQVGVVETKGMIQSFRQDSISLAEKLNESKILYQQLSNCVARTESTTEQCFKAISKLGLKVNSIEDNASQNAKVLMNKGKLMEVEIGALREDIIQLELAVQQISAKFVDVSGRITESNGRIARQESTCSLLQDRAQQYAERIGKDVKQMMQSDLMELRDSLKRREEERKISDLALKERIRTLQNRLDQLQSKQEEERQRVLQKIESKDAEATKDWHNLVSKIEEALQDQNRSIKSQEAFLTEQMNRVINTLNERTEPQQFVKKSVTPLNGGTAEQISVVQELNAIQHALEISRRKEKESVVKLSEDLCSIKNEVSLTCGKLDETLRAEILSRKSGEEKLMKAIIDLRNTQRGLEKDAKKSFNLVKDHFSKINVILKEKKANNNELHLHTNEKKWNEMVDKVTMLENTVSGNSSQKETIPEQILQNKDVEKEIDDLKSQMEDCKGNKKLVWSSIEGIEKNVHDLSKELKHCFLHLTSSLGKTKEQHFSRLQKLELHSRINRLKLVKTSSLITHASSSEYKQALDILLSMIRRKSFVKPEETSQKADCRIGDQHLFPSRLNFWSVYNAWKMYTIKRKWLPEKLWKAGTDERRKNRKGAKFKRVQRQARKVSVPVEETESSEENEEEPVEAVTDPEPTEAMPEEKPEGPVRINYEDESDHYIQYKSDESDGEDESSFPRTSTEEEDEDDDDEEEEEVEEV